MALYDPSLASSTGYLQVQGGIVEPKPVIEIALKVDAGLKKSLTASFSSLDKVEGEVLVTAVGKTKFHDMKIGFVGSSNTFCQSASRKTTTHTFLELDQPIEEAALPNPRIAEAGQTFKVPFAFVIPEKLLPDACRCSSDEEVHSMHLQLPPSMGDAATAGHGGKLREDFTEKMARISYAIRVVIRECKPDGNIATLAEKTRKVRVKPSFRRRQNLFTGCENTDYRLRNERTIRKRGFGEALGELTMEAQHPYSLRLEDTRSPTYDPLSTHTRAFLRFDPAKTDYPPPNISSLKSELKIFTFYATTPRAQFPCRDQTQRDPSVDFTSVTLPLASRSVSSGLWVKHEGQGGKPFYTANLQIPIELPTSQTFALTFHSCLISRVYRLDISIFTSTVTSLTIKVPLWILSEGDAEGIPGSPQDSQGGRISARAERDESTAPSGSSAPVSTRMLEMEWMQDASTPRNLTPPPEY